MEMTEEKLDKFKKLQDVLAKKYELENKLEELPKTLDGSTESLERTKKEYIERNAAYEAEKSKVSALRIELEETEKIREANEKSMDGIESHRDFEDLDRKIKEATIKEQEVRKELQKEEKILAEMDEMLNSEQVFIASTEKDVNEARANLEKELDGYRAELATLRDEEESISRAIDAEKGTTSETVIKFQRIIRRNSEGIVAVRGNVCDGCHMILPADFANEVHRGKDILFCPYCSRILYYEEASENVYASFSMEDAGSLADLDDDESLLDETDDEELSEEEVDDEGKALDYEEGN